MKKLLKSAIQTGLRKRGYQLTPLGNRQLLHFEYAGEVTTLEPWTFAQEDFDPQDQIMMLQCQPYTLTSRDRLYSLINALRYIVRAEVPGAIVEAGVWKGGSMMAAAKTLQRLERADRDLFLFDTFAGMPAPTPEDVLQDGSKASDYFRKLKLSPASSQWCNASLSEVRQSLQSTGYDPQKLHFIEGKVEDTLPANAPDVIALLRLDTDFYESTRHELIHLYPRVPVGGVIIFDDYGAWRGARKAVDEYLQEHNIRLLLQRIDFSGACIAVKTE